MTSPPPGSPLGGEPIARAPAPRSTGSVGDGNLVEPMKLDEFLEGIATIYDLPGREVAVTAPPPKKAKRPPARHQVWLVAVPALAVVAAVVVHLSRMEPPLSNLPEALHGAWGTTNPEYRDREFWISAKRVAFRTGPTAEDVTVHPIRRVTQTTGPGDTTSFAVDYDAEGGVITWKFQFTSSPKPVIRFANQRAMIWTLDPRRATANPLGAKR